MSVVVAQIALEHDMTPADLLAERPDGTGLAGLWAREIRADGTQGVQMWTENEPAWHAVVFSKVGPFRRDPQKDSLARAAEWEIVPPPPPPPPATP
jgi:hypothetical protein